MKIEIQTNDNRILQDAEEIRRWCILHKCLFVEYEDGTVEVYPLASLKRFEITGNTAGETSGLFATWTRDDLIETVYIVARDWLARSRDSDLATPGRIMTILEEAKAEYERRHPSARMA